MIRAPEPDVCIIGSGPAGAILGAALGRRDHDVVILEAGKRFDAGENGRRMEQTLRSPPSTDIWGMGGSRDAFSSTGTADYALNDRRVKGVGGTTLHWSGTVYRMHPGDFEMQTRHGIADDWPLSYAEIEPYYLAAEREMGAAGAPDPFGGERSGPFPMDPHPFSYSDGIFQDACEELGIHLHHVPRAINSEPFDGRAQCQSYGTCSPVCPSGAKYSADVHVREAEASGVTVIDRAPVQRLEHSSDGTAVERAVYVRDGEEHSVAADVFVVACGAVETPRLLLLSKSDTYPDGLANSSGLVGRRFMEHVAIRVRGRLDEPTRQHLIGFETAHSHQFYEYDEGPRGSIALTPLNTAGPSPLEVARQQNPTLPQVLDGNITPGATWGEEMVEHVRQESSGWLGIGAGTEIQPDPENRIALDTERNDDHDNPVPDVRLTVDDHARETLERAEELLTEIVESTGAYDVETSIEPENAFFTSHQMGTARMGTDPDGSVVDPTLQTHDLENLYLSGGSVFVTGGPASPTLTIAALTLRLADHLHDRLS